MPFTNLTFIQKAFILLKSNWISIFIIILVGLLTLKLDQGQALVIDLMHKNPINLIIFLIQVLVMAIIIAHFPIYLELRSSRQANNYKWELNTPKFLGIGFITFQNSKEDNKPYQAIDDGWVRKIIGLLFMSSVFNIFSETFRKQVHVFDESLSILPEVMLDCAIYFALGIAVLIYIFFKYFIKGSFYAKTVFYGSLCCTLVLIVFSAFYSSESGWTLGSIRLIGILTLAVMSLWYISLLVFRTKTVLKKPLHYLYLIAFFGVSSFFTLVFANIYPTFFSPLVVIMAVMNLLYGGIVILLKHRFYYRFHAKPAVTSFLFRRIAPYLVILIPAIYLLQESRGSDLHLLETVKNDEMMNYETFKVRLDEKFSKNDTLYFIASYGGGLKANLWNQLILDTLQNYDGKNILDKTIAISAVSGGAIGNAVYAAIQHEYPKEERANKINEVGKGNFLSVDLAYMFGHDLIGNFLGTWALPGSTCDRALKSMSLYENKILKGKHKLLNTSMQSYWNEMNQEKYYPVLILNSSGKHAKKGVACSLYMSDSLFQSCFHNSDNILNVKKDSSLSFFAAASTTNRFPIISPAAKIEGLGHFVDGGYFENSGMLSLMDFHDQLKRDGVLDSMNIRFIQISNDKGVSIHNLFDKNPIQKEIKESSELMTILSTKMGLNFLPYYYSEMVGYRSDFEVIRIDMPHYFPIEDLTNMFDAKSVSLSHKQDSILNKNNESIEAIRKENPFRYIEPPLSRMLGEQSINYMKDVMKQGLPFKELNEVLGKKHISAK